MYSATGHTESDATSSTDPHARSSASRRRTTMACIFCRKRKIKCDRNNDGSPCENCHTKHMKCRTLSVTQEDAYKAQGYTEDAILDMLDEEPVRPQYTHPPQQNALTPTGYAVPHVAPSALRQFQHGHVQPDLYTHHVSPTHQHMSGSFGAVHTSGAHITTTPYVPQPIHHMGVHSAQPILGQTSPPASEFTHSFPPSGRQQQQNFPIIPAHDGSTQYQSHLDYGSRGIVPGPLQGGRLPGQEPLTQYNSSGQYYGVGQMHVDHARDNSRR